MSVRVIPAWDPSQVAKVGWNGNWQSYWFCVYKRGPFGAVDVENAEVTYQMGVNDPFRKITNVGDLIMFTWGEIDWETPQGLHACRGLRDDPIFDAIYGGELEPSEGVDDFICHAFDSQAITEANDALRGHTMPTIPAPSRLQGKIPLPVPTPEERLPPGRLARYLRRSRPKNA